MKRHLAICLCLCLLLGLFCIPAAAVGPSVSASCAVLVDAATGRTLYEKDAHVQRPIASITKLMTALVAVESMESLDVTVEIDPAWTGIEGTSIYLTAGETLTLEALLYGVLLASGNDAAMAVACYCAGDVDTFVDWMNRRAADLGMENTQFSNPSGLEDEGNWSTAADMAKLAIACMENERVAQIVGTKSISLCGRTFSNHNKLLWQYDGCIGMKTGYTKAAGRTLVSCAERKGQRLIVVTLNAPDDWTDHKALFEYGFTEWPAITLCTAWKEFRRVPVTGSLVRFVPVYTAESFAYPLCLTENVTAKVTLPERVESPVQAGTVAGKITFYLEEKAVGECYLLFGTSVARNMVASHPMIQRILQIFHRGEQASVFSALAPYQFGDN